MEVLHALEPLEFHLSCFANGIRADSRKFDEFRSIAIQRDIIANADGSALIRHGNSSILVAIKAELCEPTTKNPGRGFISVNLDCTSGLDDVYSNLKQDMCLAVRILQDVVQSGELLDLTSLCIVEGKLVWILHCDLLCLDYGGNILDTAVMGLVAALASLRLPAVAVQNDKDIAVDANSKKYVDLKCILFATTFLIYENLILADPTDEEVKIFPTKVTLLCSESRLISLQKSGTIAISDDCVNSCIAKAKQRQKYFAKLINQLETIVER